jgi:hypothetical protein
LATGTVSLGGSITGFDSLKVDPGAVWQLSDTESGPLALTNDGTLDLTGQLLFGNVGHAHHKFEAGVRQDLPAARRVGC